MELDKKHIGKKAKVITTYDSLLKDSIVILRNTTTGWYTCEVIDGKWKHDISMTHDCSRFFQKDIGYEINAKALEIVEDEEIKIYDIDNPFGGMEKFK